MMRALLLVSLGLLAVGVTSAHGQYCPTCPQPGGYSVPWSAPAPGGYGYGGCNGGGYSGSYGYAPDYGGYGYAPQYAPPPRVLESYAPSYQYAPRVPFALPPRPRFELDVRFGDRRPIFFRRFR